MISERVDEVKTYYTLTL